MCPAIRVRAACLPRETARNPPERALRLCIDVRLSNERPFVVVVKEQAPCHASIAVERGAKGLVGPQLMEYLLLNFKVSLPFAGNAMNIAQRSWFLAEQYSDSVSSR